MFFSVKEEEKHSIQIDRRRVGQGCVRVKLSTTTTTELNKELRYEGAEIIRSLDLHHHLFGELADRRHLELAQQVSTTFLTTCVVTVLILYCVCH